MRQRLKHLRLVFFAAADRLDAAPVMDDDHKMRLVGTEEPIGVLAEFN
jgi:hypothetical protein